MILAAISNPSPKTIIAYAQEHNYDAIEFINREEVTYPNILKIINRLIEAARKKGCAEVCLTEIHDHYHIMEDSHTWNVSLVGFIKR